MVVAKQVAPGTILTFYVLQEHKGQRLDVFLVHMISAYSRSYFKRLIEDGVVLVNNQAAKSSFILKCGDHVSVTFPVVPACGVSWDAIKEQVAVCIVAQEPEFLIIDKPAGLMVHKPNTYSNEITLVDWLLASYAELEHVGIADRPGIIHRLDKDTSGLLIIPRTNESFGLFGNLFRSRKIDKLYWALVSGHPDKCGVIDLPIGRDPVHKHRMVHMPRSGVCRQALTSYKVLAYYQDYTLVEVRIVTGRTHQIRVHFAAIGHPVLGDSVYGEQSLLIKRQALHAKKISFTYKGHRYEFDCPVSLDMHVLINQPTI